VDEAKLAKLPPEVRFIPCGDKQLAYVNGVSAGWTCDEHGPVLPNYLTDGTASFTVALVYREKGRARKCSVSIDGAEPRPDDWLLVNDGELNLKILEDSVVLSFDPRREKDEVCSDDEGEEWKRMSRRQINEGTPSRELLFEWPRR